MTQTVSNLFNTKATFKIKMQLQHMHRQLRIKIHSFGSLYTWVMSDYQGWSRFFQAADGDRCRQHGHARQLWNQSSKKTEKKTALRSVWLLTSGDVHSETSAVTYCSHTQITEWVWGCNTSFHCSPHLRINTVHYYYSSWPGLLLLYWPGQWQKNMIIKEKKNTLVHILTVCVMAVVQ